MGDSWRNDNPPDLSVKICQVAVKKGWNGIQHYHSGLLNFGNSCYINVIVQALLHIPAFVNVLKVVSATHCSEGKDNKCSNAVNCVICAFLDTHTRMGATNSILSHKPVINVLNVISDELSVSKQADALEFLMYVFDAIVSQEIDGHILRNSLSFCAKRTTEIHALFSYWRRETSSDKSVQCGIEKVQCEKEFLPSFGCPQCLHARKGTQTCFKSWQFFTLPQILIVAVNRFGNISEESLNYERKDARPLEVNRQLTVGSETYTVCTTVAHHGALKDSGHYTCLALCPDGFWVEFDDHLMYPGADKLQEYGDLGGIYLVFYEKDVKIPQKRCRPLTPSKRSPASKKLKSPYEKRLHGRGMTHLSQRKQLFQNRRLFHRSILRTQPINDECLAQPLHDVVDTQPAPQPIIDASLNQLQTTSSGEKQVVSPLKIVRSQRVRPRLMSESESSHEYAVAHCSPKVVPPVVIKRTRRLFPKATESQSSNEYSIVRDAGKRLNESWNNIQDEELGAHLEESQTPSVTDINQRESRVKHYEEKDIMLTDNDVPGAKLPNPVIEDNYVRDLRRWLVCHGQNQQGNKTVLISRITQCMTQVDPPAVRRDVDQGEWLRKKADRMRIAYNVQCSQVIFPESGFGSFPSRDIPLGFNFGSVFHYLMETRPMLQGDSESDSEGSESEEVLVADPFHNCREYMRPKLLRRGMQYVKSGWVKGLQDFADNRFYYVKAHIRASMEPVAYWVYITISKVTGGIVQVTCGYPCPATANGRCSHVSAALLQILAHCHLNGHECKYFHSQPEIIETHGQTYCGHEMIAHAYGTSGISKESVALLHNHLNLWKFSTFEV